MTLVRAYLASLRHDAGGTLAFVATVVAAYFSLFLSSDSSFAPAVLATVLGLGVLFIFMGTYGYARVAEGGPAGVWAYLLAQLGLASLILYLCGASGFSSLIYFPLVSHAWYSLPRPQAFAASVLAVLAVLGVIALLAGLQVALENSFVILSGVIFVAVFTDQMLRELKTRREMQRLAAELVAANQKLRAYSEQVEELATAKERNRLAREIHDSLGHYLTVINVQLEAARLLLEGGPPADGTGTGRALTALSKAQSLAQEGLTDVRRSVAALRAGPNDNRPLPDSLRALADEARSAGIVAHCEVRGPARPLSAQTELTLYRAAQEALTNVRKHARASKVQVTLDYGAPEHVRLVVEDNGIGSAAPTGGFGLLGLRERVQLLGGSVSTRTAVGEGFRLEGEAPGAGGCVGVWVCEGACKRPTHSHTHTRLR